MKSHQNNDNFPTLAFINGHGHKTILSFNFYSNTYIFQEIAFTLVIILGLFARVNHIIVLTLVCVVFVFVLFLNPKNESCTVKETNVQ